MSPKKAGTMPLRTKDFLSILDLDHS